MKKIILFGFFFIASATGISAQNKMETIASNEAAAQTAPENFKSDGCTHFPDRDYLDCCVQHDLAYFKGGSWKERWRADSRLRKCVAAKSGWWHKPVSLVMWSGVRIGGVPFLPTKFRWGFGKSKVSSPKSQVEKKKSGSLASTRTSKAVEYKIRKKEAQKKIQNSFALPFFLRPSYSSSRSFISSCSKTILASSDSYSKACCSSALRTISK